MGLTFGSAGAHTHLIRVLFSSSEIYIKRNVVISTDDVFYREFLYHWAYIFGFLPYVLQILVTMCRDKESYKNTEKQ